MKRMLGVAILVIAAGCGSDKASKPEDKAPPPKKDVDKVPPVAKELPPAFDERAIQVRPVLAEKAEPPARFTAALPKTAAEMKAFEGGDEKFPPPDHVRDALCRFATPAVLAALDVAVAGDRKAIARWREFASCSGAPLCTTVAPAVTGAAKEILQPLLAEQCPTPKIEPADQAAWDEATARLRTAGMLGADPIAIPFDPRTESQPFDDLPFEILAVAGRVDGIDTEGDGRPHTMPLRRIAHLVRPVLDGALFVEASGADGVTLELYLGGERYSVPASPQDGWYDLDAAVGLINGVLEKRGSDLRVLALAGGGQVFEMAAGTKPALHAAVRAGLLRAYDGSQ